MALLDWEEVCLSTLNKIFILAHNFTMGKYGSVSVGFFRVYLCKHCGDCPDIIEFDDWGSAYKEFRYHVSFLGWHFGRIVYVNYRHDIFRELVHATYYGFDLCTVWRDNSGFQDVILYPSFEEVSA